MTAANRISSRGRVLVLWNQIEEDVYEQWRADGPRALEWDPDKLVPDVGTVAEEMDALLGALRAARFEVQTVNVEDDLDQLIGAIRDFSPDAVFNLVEYFHDDPLLESSIAGLYELLGVAYTGNRPVTLATCMNKYRTKLILEAAELPTAEFFLARRLPVPRDHGLQYPVIVKPASEDASGGIEHASVVHDWDGLQARVAHVLREFDMPALVEEYIEGREIHAAILGNDPPEVLPLFEMEFDDSRFNPKAEWRPRIISYRAKWDPHSKDFYSMDARVPPRELPGDVEAEIRRIAVGAFRALGCRDYARIDMRVDDETGQPFILEINPNPDLVDGAAYMMCAAASGRGYPDTLGAIADLAIARGRRRKELVTLPSDDLLREYMVKRAGKDGAAKPVAPATPVGVVGGAGNGKPARAGGGKRSRPAPARPPEEADQ